MIGHINDNEEEHVQVESDGNEADNKKEHVEVEYDGSESENEEKEKDEELKDSGYEYTDDEMPNIDPRMTAKMGANAGEEEPNIDPEMVHPNKDRNQPTFAIKTLSLEYECTRVDRLGYCNARWLSIRFAYKIRKNHNCDVAAMQAELQEEYAMNLERPKKSRIKEASEVEVPASVPPNPRPPNYIPPLAKLRRVFIKIRTKLMGQASLQEAEEVKVGDGNDKGKTPVASQPLSNKGDSSFSTPPNIVQSSSQPVLRPPNTGQSSPQPVSSQRRRFKPPAKRIRPPKTGQSSPQPVSSHCIIFKSPTKRARPWRL
ncbi:hypothetical protein L3X38_034369 [Prunus dulcis]|uniref:Uncharacterized protein n=1 Tax=Prunus dulcis TaxID=3755 RepID=A0AAD4VHQ9_PRUDU|nr:hypothetical protein L3X38_034369 [Prunus dulcis]